MNIHSGGGDAPNTLSPVYNFFSTRSFPKAVSILSMNPINSPKFGCAIRIVGNRTSAVTFRLEPDFAHVTEPLMHSGPLAEVFSMPFWKSYPGGNATDHFKVMVKGSSRTTPLALAAVESLSRKLQRPSHGCNPDSKRHALYVNRPAVRCP